MTKQPKNSPVPAYGAGQYQATHERRDETDQLITLLFVFSRKAITIYMGARIIGSTPGTTTTSTP